MSYPQFIKDETHDVNELGRKAIEAALYPAYSVILTHWFTPRHQYTVALQIPDGGTPDWELLLGRSFTTTLGLFPV
ncbi:hypothetical protein BD769DRAFT_1676743 [Suillus cothurnatus]|nr:hypothetical protein BD769DRAFT_1676743 [Suillus cothurnatus]